MKFLLLLTAAGLCSLLLGLYLVHRDIARQPLGSCGAPLARHSVPVTLVAAVIAQEDHGFLDHSGVNWREVWQALQANVYLGRVAYGASTIDMQVASLCYVKQHKLNRWLEKLVEVLFAYSLAQRYPKQEILRAYLSRAPFAGGIRGFEAAAQQYFRKPLHALSFEEEWSLTLALRNKDRLDPKSTATTRKLPKQISRQLTAAKRRQTQTLKWQKKRLLLFPYVRNKSFR